MQTMNLRFEQMVNTVQSIQPEKVQGTNNSTQNDSSFLAALENAQKELDSANKVEEKAPLEQEKPQVAKATEGTKDSAQEDISESEMKWISASESEVSKLIEPNDFSIDTDILDELKSFQPLVDESEVQVGELDSQESLTMSELIDLIDENSKKDGFISLNSEELNQASEKMEKLSGKKSEKSELKGDQLIYSILTGKSPEVSEIQDQTENQETGFSINNSKIEKSEGKAVISVIDERTVSPEEKTTDNFVTTIEKTGKGEVEMTMNLNQNSASSIEFEGVSQNGQAQGSGANFAQMLSQQIQTSSMDFVKAGNLVLKDENKGTINLVLHPEDLGNVRIQLEMTDKVVAGKIVVATKEAFDAFNENMNSLRQAFIESGLEAGNFDLSWSGEHSQNQEDTRNIYGNVYAENVQEVADEAYGNELAYDAIMYGSSMVNVVV